MKVYPNNRSKNFVHALLIRYIWIGLAPNEENVSYQLQNVCILEELEFLVGAVHILLDLLVEEAIGFLSYLVLTVYFFYGLMIAFIRGFLGSARGPYFPIDFGPVLDSFFSVVHLFRLPSSLAILSYQD